MSAITERLKKYTAEEYFELEKHSDVKHEYYYGERIPLPGESKNANRITTNMTLHWTRALRQKGFDKFDHDVKLSVKSGEVYRYPDFVVAPKTDTAHEYYVNEPVLIAEVASEDSWHTDSFVKLREYLALPSLHYYLIISQEEMHVEFCHKEEGKWAFEIFTKAVDQIQLPFLGLEITLEQLYEDVFPQK